jgi:putative membrane protein
MISARRARRCDAWPLRVAAQEIGGKSREILVAHSATEATPPQDPRLFMAAERMLLAWVRTGLALTGFGFVVARFGLFLHEIAAARTGGAAAVVATPQQPGAPAWIGVALVAAGVAVSVLAAAEHARVVRRLRRGDAEPVTWSAMGMILAALLAVLGIALAIYLVAPRR